MPIMLIRRAAVSRGPMMYIGLEAVEDGKTWYHDNNNPVRKIP